MCFELQIRSCPRAFYSPPLFSWTEQARDEPVAQKLRTKPVLADEADEAKSLDGEKSEHTNSMRASAKLIQLTSRETLRSYGRNLASPEAMPRRVNVVNGVRRVSLHFICQLLDLIDQV